MERKERKFFFDRLQSGTEAFLTARRAAKRVKREKQKAKNPVLDWIDALVWAASMVLICNQYLLQAYQIPSGSMIDTLLIQDKIFVNKLIFGPELLPGMAKLSSPVKPKRNDVIVFENPSYLSRGPVFDIAQRVIYMLTLTLVDIDRDVDGKPKAHFLIKRAAGSAGDWFKIKNGDFFIKFAGADEWTAESDRNKKLGYPHRLSRIMEEGEYPALEAAGKVTAYTEMNLPPPRYFLNEAAGVSSIRDNIAFQRARLMALRAVRPEDERYRTLLARYNLGWYVPEGRMFPLGDNRDNSHDGRYFGPVSDKKILGKGSFIYWPMKRIGAIR